MTLAELRILINHYVTAIKLATNVSGYRLNILLNSILDQISALGTGAPEVKHFEATAGQTTFVLDNNIRGDVFWFKNGSMTHEAPVSAIVGQKDVVLPAQPEFTNISIVS